MAKTKKEVNAYIDEFKREKYDRLVVLTPKGTKERINQVQGYSSVSAFVNAAIAEKLDNTTGSVQAKPKTVEDPTPQTKND